MEFLICLPKMLSARKQMGNGERRKRDIFPSAKFNREFIRKRYVFILLAVCTVVTNDANGKQS